MNMLGERVLDILFPKRCTWCDAVVGFGNCEDCGAQVARLAIGERALTGTEEGRVAASLAHIHAAYQYKGRVRDAIHRFKIDGCRELAAPLAAEMARSLARAPQQYDALVAIPQTRAEAGERGFNQSLLLARQLAKQLSLPVLEDALIKTRETQRQAGLARQERLRNVTDAFAPGAQAVQGLHVLLVDDIVTTGSTLEACAKELQKAGAASCAAVCLAATPPA